MSGHVVPRLAALVLVVLSALAVSAGSALASPGNGKGLATKYTAEQAQALASAPGGPDGLQVVAVPSSVAEAAAQQPGAQTEVARGYATVEDATAAANACFEWRAGWNWGTWPYDQHIDDYTYYCAVYGAYITMRSTNVVTSGTLCGTDWTRAPIVSGGIGYSWMVVQATAGFSCPTVVPWLVIHRTDWLQTAYNAWGNASHVDAS